MAYLLLFRYTALYYEQKKIKSFSGDVSWEFVLMALMASNADA